MDLKEISKPVAPYIDAFNEVFKEQMRSNMLLLDTVVKYILYQRGKQIRPTLVLLSAMACGEVSRRSYIGATMVELLHTASLVHDDVVDSAAERRGMASINEIWKNKVGVLVGDFLLARGLQISVANQEYKFLEISSNAVRRMSEGELLQIQKSRQLDIDEATYFRIIGDKTASLISSCCEIGATSTTHDTDKIAALRDYGELVGLSFQIRDDLLDYLSRTSLIGKPVGQDIAEKKLTLPLIYALSNSPKAEAKKIMSIIKSKPSNADIKRVVDFVIANGGIDYAEKKASELIRDAKQKISILQNSIAKDSLQAFADFSLKRSL